MCHLQVLWALELLGGSVVAELRNPASVVAQAELHNPGSCAICQKQLHKQSHAILRVAQAELRNPGSCASGVAQSWELRKPSFAMLGTLQQVQSAHLHSPSSTLRTAPAAAPCSGTLQRHQQPSSKAQTARSILQRHPAAATSNEAPKRKQHSDSSTLQRHPAAATSNQAPKRKQHSDSSTLQRHPAAGPATKLENTSTQSDQRVAQS